MIISFSKFHGAGNDFILINTLDQIFSPLPELISSMCARHMGIGADGIITLSRNNSGKFKMIYYNSDGHEGSMCGNGGRCFVSFLAKLGLVKDKVEFEAFDGNHKAQILSPEKIKLQLKDVSDFKLMDSNYFIDTGSPHYIVFDQNVGSLDVFSKGRKLRFNTDLFPEGSNIDFVQIENNKLYVRTYERGVESETLSCGTGVTASAMAAFLASGMKQNVWEIATKGGPLEVEFLFKNDLFSEVWLTGPVKNVFDGTFNG